jgi:hypothetical protein
MSDWCFGHYFLLEDDVKRAMDRKRMILETAEEEH